MNKIVFDDVNEKSIDNDLNFLVDDKENNIAFFLKKELYTKDEIFNAMKDFPFFSICDIDKNGDFILKIFLTEKKTKSELTTIAYDFNKYLVNEMFLKTQKKYRSEIKEGLFLEIMSQLNDASDKDCCECESRDCLDESKDSIYDDNFDLDDEEILDDEELKEIMTPWEDKYGNNDSDIDEDIIDDPEGIMIPWDEKYSDEK